MSRIIDLPDDYDTGDETSNGPGGLVPTGDEELDWGADAQRFRKAIRRAVRRLNRDEGGRANGRDGPPLFTFTTKRRANADDLDAFGPRDGDADASSVLGGDSRMGMGQDDEDRQAADEDSDITEVDEEMGDDDISDEGNGEADDSMFRDEMDDVEYGSRGRTFETPA